MDPSKNRIPEGVKSVHLIGACGSAMGALAVMLKERGLRVSGSDQQAYPPMSTFLADRGIRVMEGFSGTHLEQNPDLVIIGNTIKKDNPEAMRALQAGVPYCSMPQAINRFAAEGKGQIVVTGTHGKTTTSSIMAWVLQCAGLDPSFIIGGILRNFDRNFQNGSGPFIVLEGDEYDTAFFDKGPKFLHYTPHIGILTSVEFDHADIYRDIEHVKSAFDLFLEQIPADRILMAWGDDSTVRELVKNRACRVETYGQGEGNRWRLAEVTLSSPWTHFSVLLGNRLYGRFRTRLAGGYNLLNILATIAASHELSIPVEAVATALESFKGARRRQEIRGVKRGITVMDDFAHHPTAVRETISGLRPQYPDGRLIAVFEPRTNSSMRRVFQHVYPKAFKGADLILIREPSMLHKIPEAERFSSKKLVEDLRGNGHFAEYFPSTEAIIEYLTQTAQSGDLVLIMSNGGFDNIHERLLKKL